MASVFVTHHVKDYAAWKIIFDKDEELRQSMGMKLIALFRDQEDPNEISFLFDVANLDAMNDMLSSDEMKAKMMESGVDGEMHYQVMDMVEMHSMEHA